MNDEADRCKLAEYILETKSIVVLTGAGCSVDSGVPDFRSSQGWWWIKIDPRTVATLDALESNYELFHAFYHTRLEHLNSIQPHVGHHVLFRWQQEGKLHFLATQNVDGLHQMAGSRHIEELHGSIRSFRCHDCNGESFKEQFLLVHSCSACEASCVPMSSCLEKNCLKLHGLGV